MCALFVTPSHCTKPATFSFMQTFFLFLFKVLPDDMIVLAEPAPEDMVHAIRKAISMLPDIDPQDMHLRVCLDSTLLRRLIVALALSIFGVLLYNFFTGKLFY